MHLDGYNFTPFIRDEEENWPRKEFFYFTDDGDLAALRYQNWKVLFLEQRAEGFDVWREPFVKLRAPYLFNLRTDPLERAMHEAIDYKRWYFERIFLMVPAQGFVKQFMSTFAEFPPRQKAASFTIEKAEAAMTAVTTSGR